MTIRSPGEAKTFTAAGDITPYSLVKFDASDTTVVLADDPADLIIGCTGSVGVVSGERVDVYLDGICPVTYAGGITRGAALTTDANGHAVAAAPAATATARVIGIAMVSGVDNDLGAVKIALGSITNGANS